LVAKGRGKKESQLQPLPPFLLALRQFKTAKVLNVRLLLFIFKSFLSWGFFLAAKCQTAAKVRVQNGVPSGRGWGRGQAANTCAVFQNISLNSPIFCD